MVARNWSWFLIILLEKMIAHGDYRKKKQRIKRRREKNQIHTFVADFTFDDTYIHTDQNVCWLQVWIMKMQVKSTVCWISLSILNDKIARNSFANFNQTLWLCIFCGISLSANECIGTWFSMFSSEHGEAFNINTLNSTNLNGRF